MFAQCAKMKKHLTPENRGFVIPPRGSCAMQTTWLPVTAPNEQYGTSFMYACPILNSKSVILDHHGQIPFLCRILYYRYRTTLCFCFFSYPIYRTK
jgi:hypothetical protein